MSGSGRGAAHTHTRHRPADKLGEYLEFRMGLEECDTGGGCEDVQQCEAAYVGSFKSEMGEGNGIS